MQNVECKAELRDHALARSVCLASGGTHVHTLEQTDTYYRLADGRLKRRESRAVDGPADEHGNPPAPDVEFVFYHRQNIARPKLSRFTIYTPEQARERFGAAPMPVWIVVRKLREVYMLDNVRVHLDTVEGLGAYLELEALVTPGRNVARCHEALARLRQTFAPALGELISCGYSDLLALDGEPAPEAR